jgi:AraC-like DNA-binding protein
MSTSSTNLTRFWRPSSLGGAEFVFGSYSRQAFPRHFHEQYVIAIMVGGAERLEHARGTDVVPTGSLILLNPGQVHQNGPAVDDVEFSYRTLYAPENVVERCIPDTTRGATRLPEFGEMVVSDREAFAVLRELHAAVEVEEPTLRIQTLLVGGLTALFRKHVTAPLMRDLAPPSRRTIMLVREYLDAHFAEEISLDDLGRLAGLSTYHLVRSFREVIGLPPCQYQVHRRVLHAASQLRRGTPIAAAANEAGFVDQSHLNRHFKRIMGLTPGQFRADRKNVQDGRQC